MAEEARDFLEGRNLHRNELFFGGGVGGIVAIFLAHVRDGAFETSSWVVVGDLPPALISTSQNDTAAKALLAYIALMRGWVHTVEEGTAPPEAAGVSAPADEEHASMLTSRLDMLEEDIYPVIRDYWS